MGPTLAGGTWREIRLWDADTGEPKQTFAGNTREVESVAFSPDGNTLVSTTLEGTLLLWEVIPTAKLSLFSPNLLTQYHTQWGLPEGVKARLGKGRIAEIQYFPDGTRLVVASAIGIWFYDTATHKEVALFTGHTDIIRSIAFSPDGNTIGSASGITVRLWDTKTGELKEWLAGHTSEVYSVTFSPDGNTLASASSDDTVRLWDAKTGGHKRTLTGAHA